MSKKPKGKSWPVVVNAAAERGKWLDEISEKAHRAYWDSQQSKDLQVKQGNRLSYIRRLWKGIDAGINAKVPSGKRFSVRLTPDQLEYLKDVSSEMPSLLSLFADREAKPTSYLNAVGREALRALHLIDSPGAKDKSVRDREIVEEVEKLLKSRVEKRVALERVAGSRGLSYARVRDIYYKHKS